MATIYDPYKKESNWSSNKAPPITDEEYRAFHEYMDERRQFFKEVMGKI